MYRALASGPPSLRIPRDTGAFRAAGTCFVRVDTLVVRFRAQGERRATYGLEVIRLGVRKGANREDLITREALLPFLGWRLVSNQGIQFDSPKAGYCPSHYRTTPRFER